jgi:hypothetical protein
VTSRYTRPNRCEPGGSPVPTQQDNNDQRQQERHVENQSDRMMTWVQEHRDLHDHSPCAFLERTFGLELVDHALQTTRRPHVHLPDHVEQACNERVH